MIAQLPLSPVSDDFFESQRYWLTEPSKTQAEYLELTVMRECPSPSRTPQNSTTISSPRTPLTPPQDLGLVDLDFANTFFADFSPSAGSSAPVSATSTYWPEMPMIPTTSTEQGQRHYNLLDPAAYSLPTCSAETPAFYSPALSSSAYPTFRSASRAGYGPCAAQDDPYRPAPYQLASSQPNDRQWLDNNHYLEMSMSRADMGLLHSREGHSTSVSPSTQVNPAVFQSPSNVLGIYLDPETPSRSTVLPMRPTTQPTETAGRKYFPLASTRRIAKVQKRQPSIERRYTCSTCNRSFKKHSNLRDHESKHDTNRLPPYPCNYEDCNKRLGRKTDLLRHVNAVHKNEKGFVCEKCKKGFGRKDTLHR